MKNWRFKDYVIVLLLAAVAGLLFVAIMSTASAQEQGDCEYPGRSTNTATTCDNSDPCDPSDAAKGGSGDCESSRTQPAPISTPAKAVSQNVKTNVKTCGNGDN